MRLELTRRSEYAIRACMRLAGSDRLVSSREIAAATDVPERFLARVLVELVKAGLIEAQLGRTGGYRLVRPPRELTLLALVEAIEGPSRSARCVLRQRACDPTHACAIHPVWASAQSGLIGVLEKTTLADLVERDAALNPVTPIGPMTPQASLHERTA
jgi:Rrf2 family protein